MATDKRLDQVSQLTDFDYALIVKGTDVAKVTKQQFAELVGNLLYGATTKETLASVVAGVFNENKQLAYDFGASVARSYELTGSKMLEDEIDSGTVFVRNSTASDAPFSYGLLIIESSRLKNSTRMTRQTMINLNDKISKSRIGLFTGSSISWSEWI